MHEASVTLEPPMAAAKAVNPERNKRRSRPKRPSVTLNPRKRFWSERNRVMDWARRTSGLDTRRDRKRGRNKSRCRTSFNERPGGRWKAKAYDSALGVGPNHCPPGRVFLGSEHERLLFRSGLARGLQYAFNETGGALPCELRGQARRSPLPKCFRRGFLRDQPRDSHVGDSTIGKGPMDFEGTALPARRRVHRSHNTVQPRKAGGASSQGRSVFGRRRRK